MSWKKNIFSYILWIVYSGATCVGILGLSAYACSAAGYPAEYGFGVAGAYLLLTGLLVLFGRRLVLKNAHSDTVSDKKQYGKVLESLGIVILLAAGLWLRIGQLMSISEAAAGNAYLEAAYVTAGSSVPQVVHGATYLYLWLLHVLFLVFGNHVAVALILQIVLQLLGVFVWYFVVRRLAGVLSGMVSFAFLMLSPYMVGICAEVSPAFLLFLFYSIVLGCVAGCLKAPRNPVWVVLTGLVAGIVIYLDIFGATLLLFIISILTRNREKSKFFWHSKGAVILCAALGTVAGFFLTIGVDALASGKFFGNVLWAWYRLYQPAFSMAAVESTVLGNSIWGFVDVFLLLGGMAAGCFSFWCSKKNTRQGVWIALAVTLTGLLVWQMEKANAGSEAYLYIVFTVLAGVGIEAVFVKEKAAEVLPEVQTTVDEATAVTETEVVAEAAEPVSETASELKLQSKIQFLENPLPVPKKHMPKTLDYRLQGEDDDQFDLDVSEEDDFDI